MKIIPVVDLKNSLVVHARRGDRGHYRPIGSRLSASAKPLDVIAGLLGFYPFKEIYIADLDAITTQGQNDEEIREILLHHPDLEVWLDQGPRHIIDGPPPPPAPRLRNIFASESMNDCHDFRRVSSSRGSILSLDFIGDKFLGPEGLLEDESWWPNTVIVMSLSLVGSGMGPDFGRLDSILERAGNRNIVAAGGVRHQLDLKLLAERGISGVLMATAIHEGTITSEELQAVSER
ncbi:phosphoribosylformimino-5-aminoimidazole carboxamide ribotide isomerase [Rhodoligotrophos appendicifer]|uniref:HisA/HisF-related TIM barrel protein n=1 Tax=Rhodoligotrophos appendicifer TaxID=987056 RepID=UPI0014782967|nr:HisA/HisF-related TIM barrel protein [Rhodoligotrophos appendicifer]